MRRRRQASAGDCWRRRYEGVFSLPARCERMKLATSQRNPQVSDEFAPNCPHLSRSIEPPPAGRHGFCKTKYAGIPDESREYDNLESGRRRPYYEASMVRCFCAPKLPRPDP
jgi:hypothetical protein